MNFSKNTEKVFWSEETGRRGRNRESCGRCEDTGVENGEITQQDGEGTAMWTDGGGGGTGLRESLGFSF